MLPQVPQFIPPNRFNEKISSTSQHAFQDHTNRILGGHHCIDIGKVLHLFSLKDNQIKQWNRNFEENFGDVVILITGILLQMSCSMIKVRSAYPDIDGNSISVNMRSILCCPFFNVSHAFRPSETARTAQRSSCIAKSGNQEAIIC